MPIEPKLSKSEEINERYSDIILQDLEKFNEEEFYDYMDSFLKTLTETERKILDILTEVKEAVTMAEIRNIFTEAYLYSIFAVLKKKQEIIDRKVFEMAIYHTEGNTPLIEYPTTISFNTIALEDFAKDFYPILKTLQLDKGVSRKFLSKDRTIRETRTQKMERARKLLSKYGHIVPSGEVIKSSLEFLKQKSFVDFRIQNNNYLWFLEPKFNMNMKRLERIMQKKNKNKETK